VKFSRPLVESKMRPEIEELLTNCISRPTMVVRLADEDVVVAAVAVLVVEVSVWVTDVVAVVRTAPAHAIEKLVPSLDRLDG
jgi:hypothetical protein